MKLLNGKQVDFDLKNLTKINDLIITEETILSHFVSNDGENYLFYKVDNDGKQNYKRWLFFRISLNILHDYFAQKISLLSIIQEKTRGFVYFVDLDNDGRSKKVELLAINEIIDKYLPKTDSFYNSKPVDSIDLQSISQRHNSGILELKINGKDIDYGRMPLSVLAPLLPKLEDIRSYVARKYIKERKSKLVALADGAGTASKGKHTAKILKLDTEFDFMYSFTVPFRIILKPKGTQTSIAGMKTFSDEFAEEMINLFNAGSKTESINHYAEKYDQSLIRKYNDFVSFMQKKGLEFEFKWLNSNSNFECSEQISHNKVSNIVKNLSALSFDVDEELILNGSFFALNTKTGNYSFESSDDEILSIGKFDKAIMDISNKINFNCNYKVVIKRHIYEKYGENIKINDIITSFEMVK